MRVIALQSIYQTRRKTPHPAKRNLAFAISGTTGFTACLIPGILNRANTNYSIILALGWLASVVLAYFLTEGIDISQGERGELSALGSLISLCDDYTAITNCKIPGYGKIGDLDIVVLGPIGLLIVEVKNYQQHIVVDGDNWVAQGRYGAPQMMRSPSAQVMNQVRAMRSSLKKASLTCPVDGIIALNPTSKVRIDQMPSARIIIYDDLASEIESRPNDPKISATQIDSITAFLTSST